VVDIRNDTMQMDETDRSHPMKCKLKKRLDECYLKNKRRTKTDTLIFIFSL